MEYKAAQSELDEAAAPNPSSLPVPLAHYSFPNVGYGAPISCSAPGLIPQGTHHPCTLAPVCPSKPQPSSPSYVTQTVCHSTHSHPPCLMVH